MPITGSVGEGGTNRSRDVSLIQFMLNERRRADGFRQIAVDGISGPETIGAIRSFQENETGIVDGRIDPNGPAWNALLADYNALVSSFIINNCRRIFQNLDVSVRTAGGSLPVQFQSGISSVRSQIEALGSAISQV